MRHVIKFESKNNVIVIEIIITALIIVAIVAVNHYFPNKNVNKMYEFIAQGNFQKQENHQCVISGLLNMENYIFDVYRNNFSVVLLSKNYNNSNNLFSHNYLILFDHSKYIDERNLFANYVEAEKGNAHSLEITGKLYSKSFSKSFSYNNKIIITL